jgi:ABC-type multidrug transport system ATPase subunit/ABC-type multidrug transport system permease subunit
LNTVAAAAATVIDVRGLNKSFGRRHVVRDLALSVRRGEIFGFLGPNGSGKTTSIRMLCGLLTPDSGEGTCLGFDIRRESKSIKRRVGYMTQRFSLWEDLTIRENLRFVGRMYSMDNVGTRVDAALAQLGLAERARQLAGELSGGWKQRLALAACLLHEPQLLLLDEPTAGVDPKARRDFWDQLHEFAARGITVLVSTHYMDEAARCHKLGYMKRDRLTFGMIVGIPVIQLVLFGFAINSDPKHLPTMLQDVDRSEFSRNIGSALANSSYFAFIGEAMSEAEADRALATGRAQFVVTIPAGFSRALIRGERPAVLVEADATDPTATGNAVAALGQLAQSALAHDLTGPLSSLAARPGAFELVVHARYNPEAITQYNIVPGLMGVILTMTMVLMTGLAITREQERGTMENLLSTPATALEVMTGKIVPYVMIGLIQVTLVLLLARVIFDVPMHGNLGVLYLAVMLIGLRTFRSTLDQSEVPVGEERVCIVGHAGPETGAPLSGYA